jgi:hypothetical protein
MRALDLVRPVARLLVLAACFACAAPPPQPAWVPGLGEIMTLEQMRHAKLWFAGRAGNWPLAAYELDELEEGFADAVTLHPTHKDSPVSIAQVVPLMTSAPLVSLRTAIEARDGAGFERAYDTLTTSCNGCHQATNFGFNVVTRPSANGFPNQDFALPDTAR